MSTATNSPPKASPGPQPKVKYRDGWLDAIPAELRERPQWVVWKYTWKPGKKPKWDKVPYQSRKPRVGASSTDPATWSTFAEAVECFREHRRGLGLSGIGFVFSADDPYVGIDLDHCLDADGSALEWARPFLNRLPTYAEVSPSGRGVKLVARGTLPGKGSKKTGLGPDGGALETYDRERYFTITGALLEGSPSTIADLAGPVAALHAELFAPKKPGKVARGKTTSVISPDDETLLRLACGARNGAKFSALFDRGDTSGYDHDESRADFALCGMLAFYWGPDAAAVDRMFRRSGLYRDKWNETRGDTTYGALTIDNVLAGKTEFYSPPIPRPKQEGDGSGKGNGPHVDAGGTGDDRPDVEINTEWHVVVEESIRALARDEGIFSRGDMLVTVVREDADTVSLTGKSDLRRVAGSPKIIALSDASVGCALTKNMKFFRWKKEIKGEFVAIPDRPPDWLIKGVSTRGYWPGIRRLIAVAECPYPRADGSIVETPGYDPETGTLYTPAIRFPAIPKNPTRQDAVASWRLLESVVREFPFETEDDKSVFLAGLLNAIARTAIVGPVPGIAVVGNKAGCGKGLLIDCIGGIARGGDVPTSSYPDDKEEAKKVKVAIALSGKSIVHFDNLDEGSMYGSSGLDSALTSTIVDDRILGTSKNTGEIPMRVAFFLSGNNVSPWKDAHRRWLPCNLVTDLERPEERRGLEVPDLKSHILGRRGELVRAALTILRAHALAGWPSGDWAPLGSFEEWDRIIRGAVWFATGRDCCATRRNAADTSPARQAKIALLSGWSELPDGGHDKRGVTAAKAVELVMGDSNRYDTLRNALLQFGRDGKPATPRALGNMLRGMKGNVTEGMKFVEAGEEHKTTLWRVQRSKPESPNGGGCGGSGGCQSNHLARGSNSNHDVMVYASEAQRHKDGPEVHPPEPPHPPPASWSDDEFASQDWGDR